MNEDSKTPKREIDIIVQDKDMREFLMEFGRAYVTKGGRTLEGLLSGAKEVWGKQFEQIDELTITCEAPIFFAKVDRFMEVYGDELYKIYLTYKEERKISQGEYKDQIESLLKTFFVALEKDGKVNRESISEYSAKCFEHIKRPMTPKLKSLRSFFRERDYSVLENGFPKRKSYVYWEHSIERQSDFVAFRAKYQKCKRSSLTELALFSVYYINKFF